ncbi:MAG: SNF2-related protein, partial [Verrucomicrobiota bacterium]
MGEIVTRDQIAEFLESGGWRQLFDSGALLRGAKRARSRQVLEIRAETLETGDVEIVSQVMDEDGHRNESILAFWFESGGVNIDASCSCGVGVNCEHSAASLEYLAKAKNKRLERAFGENPHAEAMQGKTLLEAEEESKPDPVAPKLDAGGSLSFRLRVERRPEGERSAWLPEIYAVATVAYGGERVSLEPSGNLRPIVTPTGKIHRDRAKEIEAVNALYALDLLPGAEQPPVSLKKVAPPPTDGVLWRIDREAWPHPEFYWQRFRHEATPALERRGWEVRFAPDVGFKPLVFRTETWKAEIVEEGKGWFHLSAGFEIDGEVFELQPILAALVANRFLEVTEGMPGGQEFMIFLPDGRGLALPVGRFRTILTTLGDLVAFNFTDGPVKLQKLEAALVADSEALAVEGPEEVEELAARVGDFSRIDRVAVPAGLKATLREYQEDGFCWMQFLARYGLNGILADDMGLGKTLQALAHILAEKESGR